MRCRTCGRSNRTDAAFCDACGARLGILIDEVRSSTTLAQVAQTGDTASSPLLSVDRASLKGEGVFVGRHQEMGALTRGLEEAVSGRGRLVMLVGEPGIGKTRTAQELAMYAAERGAQVLWGRCYENPGVPPYWPWVEIIRSYVREREAEQVRATMGSGASHIADLVSDVRDRLPDLPAAPLLTDPEQAHFRLFDAITVFLLNAAISQPTVLTLDNLHWADKSSLLLLEFLAHELRHSRLFVVGTYRDMELSRQHPLSGTLAELTRERSLQRTLLKGLSREDVGRFVEMTAGLAPSPVLAEVLHTHTEGNPLFLTEFVRLLLQEGELTPTRWPAHETLSVKIPEGVREVIGRRLNRLSQRCVDVLTLASVIGREFSLEEVRCLIDDLSEEEVIELLDEAWAARLIEELPQTAGRYQFRYVLIRETLYDELSATRRSRLHRRIAQAMEGLYRANPEPHLARLDHHFGEAAQAGDVEKVIEYAERAGAQADAFLAYEEAARYYAMALQALERQKLDDEARRCRLLLALGEAQRKAGDSVQATKTFQRDSAVARAINSPADLAHAALGFEDSSWRPGLPGNAAVQLFEEALIALGEGDSALKARVLSGLARALAFTGAIDQGVTIGKQAVAMAQRLGDRFTVFATLRTSLYTRYAPWGPEFLADRHAAARELMQLAEREEDGSMILTAQTWNLFALMELGNIQTVDTLLDTYTQRAEEHRQPFYQYIAMSLRATKAIFEGRFAEGEGLAQQALVIGQRLRGQDALGLFGVQMFTLRREEGRLQEVAPAVRHFVQTSPEASRWRPGLALIYSELGLEREARAEFEQLAANDFADIPKDALWLLSIVYLVEVCASLGDARRAATLYQLLRPYEGYNIMVGPAVASYGASSRFLGMLAATMSRWSDAQRHFEDALAMNARMGARPWLAHTHYQYAEMLLVHGRPNDRTRAISLLEQTLTISRALGMQALDARATALLEHTIPQPGRDRSYPAGLTPREVEVLRLIALGKSNREIAEALFISLNTVANHVRNILPKIDAANRTEAAAYAISHGLTSLPPLPSGRAQG